MKGQELVSDMLNLKKVDAVERREGIAGAVRLSERRRGDPGQSWAWRQAGGVAADPGSGGHGIRSHPLSEAGRARMRARMGRRCLRVQGRGRESVTTCPGG